MISEKHSSTEPRARLPFRLAFGTRPKCANCGDDLGDSALDLCQRCTWADDPAAWSRMDQRLLREHDAATRMRTAIVRELLDDGAA